MNEEPTVEQVQKWAHSFGGVVDAYDRARPTYPREAAQWLVGQEAATVLELGAGTGKLTAQLLDLGHDVVATDPDRAMLDRLVHHLPEARTIVASAEDLSLGADAYDVVVAAQAFHWFDLDRALPEIARVLKRGGGSAWSGTRATSRSRGSAASATIIGTQEQLDEPAQVADRERLFGRVEQARSRTGSRSTARASRTSCSPRSNIAVLDAEARAAKLAEVVAFYDDYGRGMDGMQLPYVTRCFRATVVDQPGDDDPDVEAADSDDPSDGTDTDMLLIDFR
jgi:ubiquinone/menaquinone biosynthesis C-methylase UbiE